MVEFKRILCPIDLSELSGRPLAYAAALAKWYQAELVALHVVPTFDPMVVPSQRIAEPVHIVQPLSRDDVIRGLGEVLEGAGASSLGATRVAEAGDPARTIVDQAVARQADLVIMGTHGRSGFNRLLLGSVTEKVLRTAPCPVLTVPPHARAAAPAEVVFKTILCPVDFSSASLQAFGFALDLARQAQGTVTLLQVIEWLAEEEPRAHAHFNAAEYRTYLIEEARQRAQTLIADESRTWCTIDNVTALGRAHREILRVAAERSPDLIVMGAQGRGATGLALFGSTTQEVVRAARCPVLTVRGPAVAS